MNYPKMYEAIHAFITKYSLNKIGSDITYEDMDDGLKELQDSFCALNPSVKMLSALATFGLKPALTQTGYKLVGIKDSALLEAPSALSFKGRPYDYRIEQSNGVSFIPLLSEIPLANALVHDIRWLKAEGAKHLRFPILLNTCLFSEIDPGRQSRLYIDIPVYIEGHSENVVMFRLSVKVFWELQSVPIGHMITLERTNKAGFKTNIRHAPYKGNNPLPDVSDYIKTNQQSIKWLQSNEQPSYLFSLRRILDHIVVFDNAL